MFDSFLREKSLILINQSEKLILDALGAFTMGFVRALGTAEQYLIKLDTEGVSNFGEVEKWRNDADLAKYDVAFTFPQADQDIQTDLSAIIKDVISGDLSQILNG